MQKVGQSFSVKQAAQPVKRYQLNELCLRYQPDAIQMQAGGKALDKELQLLALALQHVGQDAVE